MDPTSFFISETNSILVGNEKEKGTRLDAETVRRKIELVPSVDVSLVSV
jgi:hypothetical protein